MSVVSVASSDTGRCITCRFHGPAVDHDLSAVLTLGAADSRTVRGADRFDDAAVNDNVAAAVPVAISASDSGVSGYNIFEKCRPHSFAGLSFGFQSARALLLPVDPQCGPLLHDNGLRLYMRAVAEDQI